MLEYLRRYPLGVNTKPWSGDNDSDHHELFVQGMTCGHCATSLDAEVSAVPGVSAVTVDLASGAVEVRGDKVSDEAAQVAIEAAGYELAGGR